MKRAYDICTSTLLIVLVSALSFHVAAAEFAPISLVPTRVVIAERGALTGFLLMTASNTVSFLPPDRWKVDKKSRQVVIAAPDLSATLTLQVFDNLWRTNGWNWAAVRHDLCTRNPQSHLVREIDCYASDAAGKAYDIEQKAANDAKLITRTAVVPFQSGIAEITLTTVKSRFADQTYVFGTFMSSLRFASLSANR